MMQFGPLAHISRHFVSQRFKLPLRLLFGLLSATLLLTACYTIPPSNAKSNARLSPSSRITHDLTQLPEPKKKIAIAVYGFRDQTGQFKPSPDSSYSTSVTQGAASMLVKALNDSGWYIPVEREGLQNLLTERKIVRAIESPNEKNKPLNNLPNLLPASLIIEGGILAYEENVRTGGKGANYLGVGGDTQYTVDQVTVGLRAVDIRTGQVLNAVSVTKTIYSYQFSASIYAFVSYQKLLQVETGYTTNEPAQLAVREAIESAVIHLTAQGVRDRYLELKDPQAFNSPVFQSYLMESMTNSGEEISADDAPIKMRPKAGDQVAVVEPLLTGQALARVVSPATAARPDPYLGADDARLAMPPAQKPAVIAPLMPAMPQQSSSALAAPVVQPAQPAPTAPAMQQPITSAPAAQQPAALAPAVPVPGNPAPKAPIVTDDIFKQYWRNQGQ
ncbi:MAG: CsgG/HfaB family protein [Burkholderiales bacterium]